MPEHIEAPEDTAKEALCDLIAHTPKMDVGEILRFSDELLVGRDVATSDAVIFDIDSLADHYRVSRSEMIMAARLCGARACRKGTKTVWAGAENAKLILDSQKSRRLSKISNNFRYQQKRAARCLGSADGSNLSDIGTVAVQQLNTRKHR